MKDERKGEGALGSGVKLEAAASILNDMPGLIDRRFSALEVVGTLSPLTPRPIALGDRTAVGLRVVLCDRMLPVEAEVCSVLATIGEADEEGKGEMGLGTAEVAPGVGLPVVERGDLLSTDPARGMGVSKTAGEGGTLLLRRPGAGETPVAGDPDRGRGLVADRSALASRLASPLSAYGDEMLRGDVASG